MILNREFIIQLQIRSKLKMGEKGRKEVRRVKLVSNNSYGEQEENLGKCLNETFEKVKIGECS